jgi:hypothetical protein
MALIKEVRQSIRHQTEKEPVAQWDFGEYGLAWRPARDPRRRPRIPDK